MPNEKYNEKIRKLKMVLEELAQKASQQSGFVQRESKMDGKGFAQTMVLGCLEQPDVSLNGLAQMSADLQIEISPSGLNQRIDWEAVELLRELLADSIQQVREGRDGCSDILAQFRRVYVTDSTQMSLPDSLQDIFRGNDGVASSASMKLHLCYEYQSGEISALDLTDGRAPDQKCRLHIDLASAGSLHLFDLGFFKQEHLAELDKADAYFVSRFQSQTALYWQATDETGFDVAAFTHSMEGDRCEIQVFLGRNSRVPVRVLFQRLPPKVVQERRRKAKAKMRREKKTPSERYLQMMEWAIFITNVPVSLLSFEQVLLVYRVRWQIEILFKVWKSQAHLDRLGNWRPARVLCQLFARLIGLVLFHWLVAPFLFLPTGELSYHKAFHVLQRFVPFIAQAIAFDWRLLTTTLAYLEHNLIRFTRKDSRKKSPSTFQSLVLAGA